MPTLVDPKLCTGHCGGDGLRALESGCRVESTGRHQRRTPDAVESIEHIVMTTSLELELLAESLRGRPVPVAP